MRLRLKCAPVEQKKVQSMTASFALLNNCLIDDWHINLVLKNIWNIEERISIINEMFQAYFISFSDRTCASLRGDLNSFLKMWISAVIANCPLNYQSPMGQKLFPGDKHVWEAEFLFIFIVTVHYLHFRSDAKQLGAACTDFANVPNSAFFKKKLFFLFFFFIFDEFVLLVIMTWHVKYNV